MFEERAFLVGVSIASSSSSPTSSPQSERQRGRRKEKAVSSRDNAQLPQQGYDSSGLSSTFEAEESLEELGQLVESAGLKVVGSTFQR